MPTLSVACELVLVVDTNAAVLRAKIEVKLVADEALCPAAEPEPHLVQTLRHGEIVVLNAVADADVAGVCDAVVDYAVASKTYLQPRSHPVFGWT